MVNLMLLYLGFFILFLFMFFADRKAIIEVLGPNNFCKLQKSYNQKKCFFSFPSITRCLFRIFKDNLF